MDTSLEVLFVRHGEGEHLLDQPRSLAIKHPRLTAQGRDQVGALKLVIRLTEQDMVLASPTLRTIETADILCSGAHPLKYVCPAVGPRMFPQDPRFSPLPCDDPLEPEAIRREFPDYQLHPANADSELWSGINRMPAARFAQAAQDLLRWCRECTPPRVVIVAHDGTIHAYREFLGETNLTRASFLGPAGHHRVLATI